MQKLRKWRAAQGQTSTEAGKAIGVSGVQWTRYETGERSIPLEKILDVSRLTGIPANEIRPDLVEKAIEIAEAQQEPAR